jgi:hypothetical protein
MLPVFEFVRQFFIFFLHFVYVDPMDYGDKDMNISSEFRRESGETLVWIERYWLPQFSKIIWSWPLNSLKAKAWSRSLLLKIHDDCLWQTQPLAHFKWLLNCSLWWFHLLNTIKGLMNTFVDSKAFSARKWTAQLKREVWFKIDNLIRKNWR